MSGKQKKKRRLKQTEEPIVLEGELAKPSEEIPKLKKPEDYPPDQHCPKCGSIEIFGYPAGFECLDCGHVWRRSSIFEGGPPIFR